MFSEVVHLDTEFHDRSDAFNLICTFWRFQVKIRKSRGAGEKSKWRASLF